MNDRGTEYPEASFLIGVHRRLRPKDRSRELTVVGNLRRMVFAEIFQRLWTPEPEYAMEEMDGARFRSKTHVLRCYDRPQNERDIPTLSVERRASD